jgi:hypothetical protein
LIKQNLKPLNILDLKPRQLYPSELADKGKVVVLVPEPQSKLVEWFTPKKNRMNLRVKLDIFGSAVWDQCDGRKTVKDIAERMKQDYGTFAEPVDKRVSGYIKQLQIKKFIDVDLGSERNRGSFQK